MTPCVDPAEVFSRADYVVVTAPLTPETLGILEPFLRNLDAYLRDQPLSNLVDLERGY